MSSSVVSNYLFGFISDIEDVFVDYSKKHPNATYDDFYKYLDSAGESSERDGVKLSITLKLLEVCYKIDQMRKNEIEFNETRQDSLVRLKVAISLVFSVMSVVFVVVLILIAKAYKNDWFKGGKMILTFVIIYLVVTTLYVLFMMFIANQKKVAKRSRDESVSSITRFLRFMHEGEVKMTIDPEKQLKSFVAFRNERKKPNAKQTDIAFTVSEWSKYTSLVLKNVHARGKGLRSLKIVETTSNNIKVLKGVNEVLGTYYDLMLKSRQNFADASTKEGIMKILDATVVKELGAIDVFSLDDTAIVKDNEFIDNMEDGEHYKMLLKGFRHLMVYLYPVYKNVSYKQLVQLEKDEEALKNKKSGEGSKLKDSEKDQINQAMLEDPILMEVRRMYPLERANFVDEMRLMKRYDEVDSTKDKVQVVSDFINDTMSTFKNINETENEKYLSLMNKAPSPSETQILMKDYATTFNAYFEKLYKQFIEKELGPMNPTSGQYFVFNPRFMEDTLLTEIDNSNVLSRLEPDYKKMVMAIVIKDIIPEQKNRFIATYFAFDKEKDKSLKALQINSRIMAMTQKVSSVLSAYDFKVSDYAKYIMAKVQGSGAGVGNISTNVQGAIETVLSNIDHEVGLQKGLVSKNLSEMSQEMRFVPVHDFVYNLDQYKMSTLHRALNPEYLKQIVDTINPDGSKIFAGREFNVNIANTLQKMLIAIIVPSYLLYAVTLLNKAKDNINVFKNGAKDDQGRLDLLLQGDPLWGSVVKFGVPLAGSFLFIAIFNSYVVKARYNIEFNKEIMRENTEQIKQSVNELNNILMTLNAKISMEDGAKPIGEIKEFDMETKQKLYKAIKNILITYDKCNYIVGIDKYDIPFPYAEVLTDGVMSLLLIGIIVYILSKFAPLTRIVELKDLYEYKETSQTLVNDPSFVSEIMTKFACHKDEVDGIMFTVKAIASMSVVIFMILYSLRITTSTSEYKGGLYSSGLYESKNCAA
jgi:hypothetical protein